MWLSGLSAPQKSHSSPVLQHSASLDGVWGLQSHPSESSLWATSTRISVCQSLKIYRFFLSLSLWSCAAPCLFVNIFFNPFPLPCKKKDISINKKICLLFDFQYNPLSELSGQSKRPGAFSTLLMIYEKLYGISWENRSQH